METITVVVPVYNSAKYIDRFFQALEIQTYKNFKCIFVLDKSGDDTGTLLQKRCDGEKGFSSQILVKPKLEGAGKARDYALDSGLIDTKYVIFVDTDDLPHKTFLEELDKSIEASDSDMAICGYQRLSSVDNHVISTEMVENPELITDISSSLTVPLINPAPWNKLIKTSIIQDARFIYPGGSAEDLMFLCKILPSCKKISFVNSVLYDYFINPSSVSLTTDEQAIIEIENGFLETKEFLHSHSFDSSMDVLIAFVFLRLGIGATTRACLKNKKNKKKIIAQTKKYMDENFPAWRKNKYWRLKSCLRHGLKTLMVWRCKKLYQINMFSLFVWEYSSFTKLFKKDIKW